MQPELRREVPTIETERLFMRALRASDAAAIFAYAKDWEVAQHTLWEPHQSPRESQAFLDFASDKFRAGLMFVWGITVQPVDRVVGTIGLANYAPQDLRAELGFALARDYWNQGITTEAARAVLRFGFAEIGLNRIEAQCKPANFASARVLRKVGMEFEGLLRQRQMIKGQFEDLELYALLKSDWERNLQVY